MLCCYFRPKMFSPSDRVRYHSRAVDVEVVWAKSARGVWGLGHVFDGKWYFTRDICEEKWIPKDLVPPKKSVAARRQEQRLPPSQEQSQLPNGLV